MLMTDFHENLKQFLIKWFPIGNERFLTREENTTIENLASKKYKSWAWTYGYSPDYQFERVLVLGSDRAEIRLKVRKGTIIKAEPLNNPAPNLLTLLAGSLIGISHYDEAIFQAFKASHLIPEPNEMIYKEIVNQLI